MKYKRKHQSFLQANSILAAILQIFCNLEVDKVKRESGRAKIRSWRSISLWVPPPLAVITLGRTRPVCDFF